MHPVLSTGLSTAARAALVLGLLGVPAWAAADERAALARIAHELHALDDMVREAEAQGGRGRIRFQYPLLRADLEKMRRGVEDYLTEPSEIPRAVEPLRGDYRR